MELSIVFGGVVVSLIIQGIKKYFGTSRFVTILSTVILSIVGGFAYAWLNKNGMWQQALQILAVSGSFYAFIVKSIETGLKK